MAATIAQREKARQSSQVYSTGRQVPTNPLIALITFESNSVVHALQMGNNNIALRFISSNAI